MFRYLRFRWQLWLLERADRRAERVNNAAIKKAKADKASSDTLEMLEHERASDGWHYEDEIRQLHSIYLCRAAARLLVPRPPLQDEAMWEHQGANRVCLTEHGVNHMRGAIRAERKAKVELFLMWVPGVVGILGTLIGLAAVLIGKR